ncbi:MAG: hypothetical protein O3A63_09925 [Proteobacteria bacterium]|nr:hypothetical protein [Pseudomonadota bacterium]
MTLQDWGALGEIIGGIAVIATLIYLAQQIRNTNTATHRRGYSDGARENSDFWMSLARDFDLYELYIRMLRAPEDLSPSDIDRAYLVLDSYLSLMEGYFLHNRQYREHLSQERWSRILSQIFSTRGGAGYWLKRKSFFQNEFVDYIDSLDVKPRVRPDVSDPRI